MASLNTLAFFDDFGLSRRTQFRRRYFSPEIIHESQFFDPDYLLTYSSLHWCPEVNKYRLWYNINHEICIHGRNEEHFMLALAESDDAIHWERPNHHRRADGRNIVFSGAEGSLHGAMVYRDPNDIQFPYKCATSMDSMRRAIQHVAPGIIATSPDGLSWNEHGQQFRWGHSMSDAYNCLLFNPVLNEYQVLYRSVLTDRRIVTSHSKDMISWSRPTLMLAPDGQDPECAEFYGMSAYQQDGIFYGFLWIFDTDMFDSLPWKWHGNVTTELVYSYNGLNWNRTRQPAIPLQPLGMYGATQNYLCNMTPDRTGENWLISGFFPWHEHGTVGQEESARNISTNRSVAHYTCRIRPGRFCGLQSNGHAFLRTKNLLQNGDGLTINVNCPNGQMLVQLIDLWHKPIKGFTFEDAIPFTGDAIAHQPQWRERSMAELRGKRYAIEIKLFTGCVFGITGDFYPFHGALPQRGYGDPADVVTEVFGNTVDYDQIVPE